MRVSVFGLGYVGCATAASLAGSGHEVLGVDISERKVRMINRGESPIVERDFDALIRSGARRGRLAGCADGLKAVAESDLSLITVGSPTKRNGEFDYGFLLNAIWQIGEALKKKSTFHVIGLRSAVPPGTTESLVIPELEKISGKPAGSDFAVCVNPEFLRSGSAWEDPARPPFVVVGSRAGQGQEVWQQIYHGAERILHTEIKTAEMLKCTCDALSLLKANFAGEMSKIPHDRSGAARKLIDLLYSQANLDRSRVDLTPHPAAGSRATSSDMRPILRQARHWHVEPPVLKMLLQSLRQQTRDGADQAINASAGAAAGDERRILAQGKASGDC
jgi:GDP-mannose 6-dehydrogenase